MLSVPRPRPAAQVAHHRLESSSLRSAGYDPDTQVLETEYVNGGVYHYYDVPEFVFRQLLRAPSPGSFLNSRIKPHYSFREV